MNAVEESDETNNCYYGSINILPAPPKFVDINISDLSLNASTAAAGDYVSASFRIGNAGNTYTGYSITNRYGVIQAALRWSTDPIITEEDMELGMGTAPGFNAEEDQAFDIQLQIPADQLNGRYYIGLCAEPVYALYPISDFNTTNDCAAIPIIVQLPKSADLQISDFALSTQIVQPGDPLWLSFSVRNAGNAATAGFSNAVWWSDDTRITKNDMMIRDFGFAGINAGESFAVGPIKLDIPANQPSGIHSLAVCADSYFDAGNRVVEINEENNCATVPVTVVSPTGRPTRQRPAHIPGQTRSGSHECSNRRACAP